MLNYEAFKSIGTPPMFKGSCTLSLVLRVPSLTHAFTLNVYFNVQNLTHFC